MRRPGETVAAGVMWGSAVLVAGVFLALCGHVLWYGLPGLTARYLVDVPSKAGIAGGIGPVVLGTAYIVLVAAGIALPVGVGTAVLLQEYSRPGSTGAAVIRRSLDVLGGIPSIVYGLFGYKLFCEILGLGWSILSGGLTLACMSLPLFVRSTEEGLRAVSSEQRLGCAALGLSRTGSLWHVLLPAAAPSIVAGLVLGLGRSLAETAVLMFTAGASTRWPESILDPARALAYHVYLLAMDVPGGQPRAWNSALVLLVMIAIITSAAQAAGARWARRRAGAHA